MKVRLLRAARITHNAGEIVEVSPDQAAFLLSVGSAESVVAAVKETPEKATTKTTRKK
jgi:hypothetical protein